jgi:hypothetical protein
MNVKVGDLVYSGLGNLGLVKRHIPVWRNASSVSAYQIEWINGSYWEEEVYEETVLSWRVNYLNEFETDKNILDSDARL